MSFRLNRKQISEIALDFEREMSEANAKGEILEFLKNHSINFDEYDECDYDKRRARLLIAGDSLVGKDDILKILKRLGIDKDRVDFMLDYDRCGNYNWNNLRFQFTYSDFIMGPIGHSAPGKNDHGSLISSMEQEDGWPHIIRAEGLKLTKTSVEKALIQSEFYLKNLSNYR